MEREELLTKFNEMLGSTKLSLSERTLNDYADDVLSGITDDAQLTDEFLGRKVNFLKSLDGNLHSDVSKEIEVYKKNFKPKKEEPVKEEPVKEEVHDDRIAELEKKFEELLQQREKEKESMAKDKMFEDAVSSLKSKFSKAEVVLNNYILKQSLRDVEFSETDDLKSLSDKIEKMYYSNLKEAGIEYDSPNAGGNYIVNKKAENAKSRREALKSEMISRGYLPKKKN